MQRELIKLELELETGNKKAKTVRTTKAPEPIKPVSGGSATAKSLNDDNLTFEEHEALLNAQRKQTAGGFI
jgi:hypothetical protein